MTLRRRRLRFLPRGRSAARPVAAALLLYLAAAVPAAGGVTVVMPKDRSVVRTDQLLVYGVGEPGQKVTVRLEGEGGAQQAAVRCKSNGWFKFKVGIGTGLTRVQVGGEERRLFLPGPGRDPPPGFLPLFLHTGMALQCATCHHEDGAVRGGGYPDVCFQCHVIEVANPRQRGELSGDRHFQASGRRCGDCHDPHGDRDMSVLRGTSGELCGQCHGSFGPAEGLHGAFTRGGCMACHDAHISGFPQLLTQPVPGACTSCHDQAESGPGDHPDELTECSGCHDPHGAAGTGLLRPEVDDRCRECHDGVGDGETVHPALDEGCTACHHPHRDDDLDRAAATCDGCHELEGEGGVWQQHGGLEIPVGICVRCHPPHAASGDRLLRNGFHDPVAERDCTACHQDTTARGLRMDGAAAPCEDCHSVLEDLAADNAPLHEPLGDLDCTICHDPHRSDQPSLLVFPQAELCGECHEVLDSEPDAMTHDAAETCTDCHRPHGGRNRQFLVLRPPALCLECHDDPEDSGEDLHPALEWGCTGCHRPHTGVPPAVLVSDERHLCLACHDAPAAGATQVHGAVGAGCTGCHEPHLWRRDHLLRAAPEELCTGCHPYAEEAPGRMVHEPVEDCTGCHRAVSHGDDSVNHLESQPPELCLECHDDPAEGAGEVHPALDDGCTACHDPHRGQSPGLLAGDSPRAPCLECHDDPTGGRAVEHPALEEGCSVCHRPHAGENPALLREPGNRMCLECHDDPAEGVAVVHPPVARDCTLCHDPHAGAAGALLPQAGNGLCLGCHAVDRHQHSLDAVAGVERFPDSAAFPAEDGVFGCLGCHRPHGSTARNLLKNQQELCAACHQI